MTELDVVRDDADIHEDVLKHCWEHFRLIFPDGSEVCIEDSNGKFYWGRLVAKEEELVLVRPEGKWHTIHWDQVELVSHDGFPVRKLRKMTIEEAQARASHTAEELVREALEHMGEEATFGGGCPFIAGPCELIGVRNLGSRELWGSGVETLTLRAKDGALMISYCTSHLFLL